MIEIVVCALIIVLIIGLVLEITRDKGRKTADQSILDWMVPNVTSRLQMLAFIELTIKEVEWMPIHDPDTHELLGQVCYWCTGKPHHPTCRRQGSLELIKKLIDHERN